MKAILQKIKQLFRKGKPAEEFVVFPALQKATHDAKPEYDEVIDDVGIIPKTGEE